MIAHYSNIPSMDIGTNCQRTCRQSLVVLNPKLPPVSLLTTYWRYRVPIVAGNLTASTSSPHNVSSICRLMCTYSLVGFKLMKKNPPRYARSNTPPTNQFRKFCSKYAVRFCSRTRTYASLSLPKLTPKMTNVKVEML